jgi:hypothetical protein
MSWSVSTTGKPGDVKTELARQFAFPLADPPAGLADDGERETVKRISETIAQCLDTFDQEKTVTVSANGHMGFANWDTKAGAYQQVSISIQPG